MQADIIIPVWNHLDDLTKRVVASVRANTVVSYQLIVVDDGSTDGTAAWLAAQDDIITITNATNLGWAAATNRGLMASTAPYVVLLNNDVTVSKNWLGLLIEGLEAHPTAGLISPACICRIEASPGPDGVGVQSRSPGFACVVLRREVIQDIGLLDECILLYGDADFAHRMKLGGWQFALHHRVPATHDSQATMWDYDNLQKRYKLGKRQLQEKWPDYGNA